MTRKEALRKCEEVTNDTSLTITEKEEKIVDFIMKTEEKYSEKDVRSFIAQLSKSINADIDLEPAKLWNMLRDKS